MAFISLSLFIIFLSFFCLYKLRSNHQKYVEESKNEEKNSVELKEYLDKDNWKKI